ncbi:hypothetical protein CROQUDRAFT_650282 [Cronartium quercuum f. sp. fusiforme G11]|uniref:CCHC-type domain-containing protein n=1 Tax=Cronartium quercuum f. sp. fusiforme G11 TaxID=708437 RepID=A0A9P6NRS9_9BASI|nr:hypothetical protein CROQUDRAFT_650282 [Cronartium quercuum f. sp. fusiforme G11]
MMDEPQLFIFDTTSDPRLIGLPKSAQLELQTSSKLTSKSKSNGSPTLPNSTTSTSASPILPLSPTLDHTVLTEHPSEIEFNDSAPPARRYWKDPTGITCTICHEPDHSAKNCDHQLCLTCGAIDEHITRLCPVTLVCYACGSRGHLSRHCPSSATSRILGKDCLRCGSTNHLSLNCPMIWRCYEELKIPGRKPKAIKPACYNCGDSGDHFGDECPFGRAGRCHQRPEPSAFSIRDYSHEHFNQSNARSGRHQHPHHSGTRDSDRYTRDSDRHTRDSDRYTRDSDRYTRGSDHHNRNHDARSGRHQHHHHSGTRDSDRYTRDSDRSTRESDRYARDSDYHNRNYEPSSHPPTHHHSRRPAPLPYEEEDEEEEDWFSRRQRSKQDNSRSSSHRPPLQASSRDQTGGPRKQQNGSGSQKKKKKPKSVRGDAEREVHQSGGNPGHGGGGGGEDSQSKRPRIGGSYKGGYTKR